MAYTAPTFSTLSLEGVDLTTVYTPYVSTSALSTTNDPAYPGSPFALGQETVAANGSLWLFVKFNGGINQYDVVMVDTSFNAIQILGGAAAAVPSMRVGFFQNSTAATSGQYGWVMVSGQPTINVLGSAVKNVQLYTTDTSGKLDDAVATGSQFPIRGVYLLTTIGTASASSGVAQASYPTVGPIGTV